MKKDYNQELAIVDRDITVILRRIAFYKRNAFFSEIPLQLTLLRDLLFEKEFYVHLLTSG